MYVLEICKSFTITLSDVGWSSRSMKISETPYSVFFQNALTMDCAPHRLQKHFYLLANISQSMAYFDLWLHRVQL